MILKYKNPLNPYFNKMFIIRVSTTHGYFSARERPILSLCFIKSGSSTNAKDRLLNPGRNDSILSGHLYHKRLFFYFLSSFFLSFFLPPVHGRIKASQANCEQPPAAFLSVNLTGIAPIMAERTNRGAEGGSAYERASALSPTRSRCVIERQCGIWQLRFPALLDVPSNTIFPECIEWPMAEFRH